jgi:flagellar hook protein FlgE
MQIGKVFATASSALRVESQRLAQSARNVANVNTDGYQPQRVDSETRITGGVTSSSAGTYARNALVQPTQQGMSTAPSNTDIADETVSQLSSLRAFQANVVVLHTSDQMLGELINQKA